MSMTIEQARTLVVGELVFVDAVATGGVYYGELNLERELTAEAGQIAKVETVRHSAASQGWMVTVSILTGPAAGVCNTFDQGDAPPCFPFRRLTAGESKVAQLVGATPFAISERYNAMAADPNGDDTGHDSIAPSGDTFNDYDDEIRNWSGNFDRIKTTADDLEGRLSALIEAGLTFAQSVPAFAEHQRQTEPHLAAYVEGADSLKIVRDGELEIDGDAIVSKGEDKGAYVMAWLWVEDEDAGITTAQDEDEED